MCACLYLPNVCSALMPPARAPETGRQLAATTPLDCAPVFGFLAQYDDGTQTTVGTHPSGLVLEFHQTNRTFDSALWYRLGTADGTSVRWSGSQGSGIAGYWPAVAISKEGYVIVVHSDRRVKSGSDLYYQVGKIDPYGGTSQSIRWLTDPIHWDAGFHASIAINDKGVIVGVHEAGRGGSGLYYRVGHLSDPANGAYTIQWESTPWGVRYDTGINPSIALNSFNEVVQVHQVPGEYLLHYRRGTVSGGVISFGESKRFDNNAEQPDVVLLDSGLVLEVASKNGINLRTGQLSLTNPDEIEWSKEVTVESNLRSYPALATTATHAILTCENSGLQLYLYASAAPLCSPDQANTLLE
jgi:hypothetical protein